MPLKRIGTGVVFLAGAVLVFWMELQTGTSYATGILCLVAALRALYEFYRACRGSGFQPFVWAGVSCGGLVVVAVWLEANDWAGGLPLASFAFFACLCLVLSSGVWHRIDREGMADMAVTVFGVIYIPFLAAYAVRLRALPRVGLEALLIVVAAVWAADVAAYVVGSLMGRTRLAPMLSPRKTVEGLVAGFLFGIVGGVAAAAWWPEGIGILPGGLVAGTLVSVVAPLGDLSESYIKRALGIKDSGRIFPGHGGVLDRIDSLLLAFPVVYFCLLWLQSVRG